MMRPGDKMDSYRMLAEALKQLADLPWQLSIVGDGPYRGETEALFADFGPERIVWHGEQPQEAIAALLSDSAVYVWPGCGEAYGLAYLEAQAAGVPVVAQAIAGVPEVVEHGRTGLLTSAGDIAAYANAIRRLLSDETERTSLAAAARRFVRDERSLDTASVRLDTILKQHVDSTR
jgi:glycosyltransferase involved in cell wall biosynthesis